jgi:general stress protein YciG
MTKQEAGRLGGKATSLKYGKEHFSRLGKKGFKALCRKFPGNSRRFALMHLNGKGIVKARYVPRNHAHDDASDLYAYIDAGEELPF